MSEYSESIDDTINRARQRFINKKFKEFMHIILEDPPSWIIHEAQEYMLETDAMPNSDEIKRASQQLRESISVFTL